MMLCEKRGYQEGAQQTKLQIALNLRQEGASSDLIFKATGLRVEELGETGSARSSFPEPQ